MYFLQDSVKSESDLDFICWYAQLVDSKQSGVAIIKRVEAYIG